jgi:uncharacterized protein (TIGR02453 family)
MKKQISHDFEGFTKKGPQFLSELAHNNSKPWFAENRQRYLDHVLTPTQSLFRALEPVMLKIDPLFMTDPRPGKAITRPHRDTRFAADKAPYKSNIWFTYRRAIKEWQDCPVFYFELMPEGYRYGMGFFMASRQTMDGFRAIIDKDPARITRAAKSVFTAGFSVEGDCYARPLKEKPENLALWYNRKNLYLMIEKPHDKTLFSHELVTMLSDAFKAIKPLYEIMCEASDIGRSTVTKR